MKLKYVIKCSAVVTKNIEVEGSNAKEAKENAEQLARQFLWDHNLDDVDTACKWDGNMKSEVDHLIL